ncbi:MAG: helix-turn-helix transcriptional regulator [Candidatus Promineifilaceae bacterium]|nr:helix-turn-helix transcriptional regulator [Candidatus Promineifilaceae bacterium]
MEQDPEGYIKNQLPLTETTYFIMLSLATGKKHGYRIMKDVKNISDGRLTLGTGTLYGALGRLLEYGWIKRVDEKQEMGRPRNAYTLSDLGLRILSAETERLQSVVSVAKLRLADL